MGNQLAVLTHTKRGQEIILEENCHIFNYEVGGMAFLAGVQAKLLKGKEGILDAKEVENSIRIDDIHFPSTGLICMENTHNRAGGIAIHPDKMEPVYRVAKKHNILVHLDGARVFNAAVALGVDVKDITRYCDTVMFCISKGLCAPVGSLLAGDRAFIQRARKIRKMLGGGMRQSGILAAAGIVALTEMVDRLAIDHENAKALAEGLANIHGIKIDVARVQTNIVIFDISQTGMNGDQLVERLKPFGIKAIGSPNGIVRFVTHRYVTRRDVERVLDVMAKIINGVSPLARAN
jgi:threonine aldolase